jgi:hypothetical protein
LHPTERPVLLRPMLLLPAVPTPRDSVLLLLLLSKAHCLLLRATNVQSPMLLLLPTSAGTFFSLVLLFRTTLPLLPYSLLLSTLGYFLQHRHDELDIQLRMLGKCAVGQSGGSQPKPSIGR